MCQSSASCQRILSGKNVFGLLSDLLARPSTLRGSAPANGRLSFSFIPPPARIDRRRRPLLWRYSPEWECRLHASCRVQIFCSRSIPSGRLGTRPSRIFQWRFRLRLRHPDLPKSDRKAGSGGFLPRLPWKLCAPGNGARPLCRDPGKGRRNRNHTGRFRRASDLLRRGTTHRVVVVPGCCLRTRPGDMGTQSAYEYVFNGVVSGNATVFDEVLLAPVNATIAVGKDRLEIRSRRMPVTTTFCADPFEPMVEQSMRLLDGYFAAVAASFGDRVTCALSGGYDSRLILALLRRHGISPRVYVYGQPGDKDVQLARAIAEGEGFALEIVDKDKQLAFAPNEFAAVAYENFLASDGYTWSGIFTNGAERAQRASRVNGNAVALNGGGGEIWRNFFYLLDRNYTPREILWSFYSQFDPETCTAAFDQENYFRQLEGKLEALIGCPEPSLPRPLVEWLYHYFRCRAWDGRVNNINNTYGYVALPFLERAVTEHASAIPIAWKNHGAYEAELIRRADSAAGVLSFGLWPRFQRTAALVRRLDRLRHLFATALAAPLRYRVKNRVRRAGEWPEYLQQEYRDAALPGGVQVMTELFQLDRVTDPAQTARILTPRIFGQAVRRKHPGRFSSFYFARVPRNVRHSRDLRFPRVRRCRPRFAAPDDRYPRPSWTGRRRFPFCAGDRPGPSPARDHRSRDRRPAACSTRTARCASSSTARSTIFSR